LSLAPETDPRAGHDTGVPEARPRVTEPRFFAAPEELRDWLEAHHETEPELWLGYHKKATGRPSVTWEQAVEEALCVGWIDGRVQRIDGESHMQRFTPRRRGSVWSKVNIAKVAALTEAGRMRPAGLAAFAARREDRSGIYSFERDEPAALEPDAEARFRAAGEAWAFFAAQPPGYRRTATHWVVSAKRAETRERRLETLIADSAAGRRLAHLTRG
jgi:uncharacterized protein YdeI (YjbR/CyaY-like superfamily)